MTSKGRVLNYDRSIGVFPQTGSKKPSSYIGARVEARDVYQSNCLTTKEVRQLDILSASA